MSLVRSLNVRALIVAGGGGSTARSSTYSSRGLYTMPHDYDSDPESKYAGQQTKGRFGPGVGGGIAARYTDEVDEGMVAVEGRGTGLHSAPPPGPNAAYIGGGKYVDTSMEASVIAGEGSIRPNSAKGYLIRLYVQIALEGYLNRIEYKFFLTGADEENFDTNFELCTQIS